ncbi:flagellar hook-basal body protein [Xylophilus sp. ASV27]|uniref:flagellar hook-basal body protein n=1 Tax=Xylophilus sp. ASV27 TaxID=2795129 RepID=UPI0018ED4AFE|nr:flagellar hook-basal body protein [Xylophilus sp. ASV27]
MQQILALGLKSMRDDTLRLDYVAANLANAMTPGYKREVTVGVTVPLVNPQFSAMVDGLHAGSSSSAIANSLPPFSPSMLVQADVSVGTLKSTGRGLDLALAGPGYFEVLTEAGPAYTRQGDFRIDGRGRLVTAAGQLVMGQGGEIRLNAAEPVIDAAGNVFESQGAAAAFTDGGSGKALGTGMHPADAQPVARLKVVQFDDPKAIQRQGGGLVQGAGVPTQMKDADIQVRQGYLENSNVSAMQEMVQMIQTMRHFESMQKVAISYDDMTGQAVRKLGDLA